MSEPFKTKRIVAGIVYAALAVAGYALVFRHTQASPISIRPSAKATAMTQEGGPVITGILPARGVAGTQVVISGERLSFPSSPAQVRFGGVVVTPSFATARQVVAAAPAGAGSGPITVTTIYGSTTSTQSFTYEGPSISLSPERRIVPIGAPTPITLVADGLPPNPVVEWSVNGIVGGNATIGTIVGTGLTATYTAPAAIPVCGQSIQITARVSQPDLIAVTVVVGLRVVSPGS